MHAPSASTSRSGSPRCRSTCSFRSRPSQARRMAPGAELFRELFMLDPEVTYLNHGSFGAVPRPVFERQNALRLELELEPVLFLARRLPGRLAQVRQSIARYVGAAAGDD